MASPLIEFSQAIGALNKEKKYDESLKYFKENKSVFTDEEIASNDSLISAMLSALRHTENFDNAFKFLDHYKIEIDEKTSEFVLNAYSWLLYSKFKEENLNVEKPDTETEVFAEDDEVVENKYAQISKNKSDIIVKIEKVLPLLLEFSNEFVELVFSKLFISVLQAEKKKKNSDWEFVINFCNIFTPEQLKTTCRIIEVPIKGEMKPLELASDREYWYAFQTTALLKLGKFQLCLELSKKAISEFKELHYSNEIWFARRAALSKKNLGKSSEAIIDLEKILVKQKIWCIQKDLSTIYYEIKGFEKSFKYAIDALNNIGDLKYKVELLFLLGDILKSKKETDLSFKHFSLASLLRTQEGWSISPKLQAVLAEQEKNIPIEKLPVLKNELKKYWATYNSRNQKQSVAV